MPVSIQDLIQWWLLFRFFVIHFVLIKDLFLVFLNFEYVFNLLLLVKTVGKRRFVILVMGLLHRVHWRFRDLRRRFVLLLISKMVLAYEDIISNFAREKEFMDGVVSFGTREIEEITCCQSCVYARMILLLTLCILEIPCQFLLLLFLLLLLLKYILVKIYIG